MWSKVLHSVKYKWKTSGNNISVLNIEDPEQGFWYLIVNTLESHSLEISNQYALPNGDSAIRVAFRLTDWTIYFRTGSIISNGNLEFSVSNPIVFLICGVWINSMRPEYIGIYSAGYILNVVSWCKMFVRPNELSYWLLDAKQARSSCHCWHRPMTPYGVTRQHWVN